MNKYTFYINYNTINPQQNGNCSISATAENPSKALFIIFQSNCFPPKNNTFVQINSVKLL